MKAIVILLGAVAIGLLAGGGMAAWDHWRALPPKAIARGLAGELECTSPDETARTCEALASYSRGAEGYSSTGTVYAGPSPGGSVTLTLTTPFTVRGDYFCTTLTRSIVMGAKVTIGGEVMPRNPEALNFLAKRLAPLMEVERCTRFVEDANGITEEAWVGGKRNPTLDVPIRWVKPEDGYRVGP